MSLLSLGTISTNKMNSGQLLLWTSIPAVVVYGLSRINWPRTIFRFVFGIVAPTKERFWPSDDPQISPGARGMAWILLAGPPPPHDVQPIRTMMKYFWPNVWPTPPPGTIQVDVVPTPRATSQSLWITPSSCSNTCTQCLIHLHGGGMIAGTTGTERGLAVELARRLGVPVLSVDYRLVPEATIQQAVEDVVTAYQWLRKTHPHLTKLSFLGGSAGAGHSLLAAIRLQELDLDVKPTSLVLSSPGPGMEFLPSQVAATVEETRRTWKHLDKNAPHDGYMAGEFYQFVTSIVYQDPANREYLTQQLSKLSKGKLPPCLVTAGSYEVLLDGVHALVDALQTEQVPVVYKEYWKMQHCHFCFFEFTPEASDALDELILWLNKSWNKE
ncbi:Acetyl esterase [Seminavis robusta]|uniref:Acetyl esterase n=1 Tax=Seminavis robusta TaxID=568900 RepID=A0A9N8DHE8_9STRA|nr:Acetyl esterase [Seminavis robusta]|eukprot:Sro92_g048030.1 Acetyl esterase (384) ;mRNA; f:37140-38291